jgi:hypothetical protein
LLVVPDDPEVCGHSPEHRHGLHRKRATMWMPWLLLSAAGFGHEQPRKM